MEDGRIISLATGEQTGGSFSQVLTDDPRGTATPLHLHRDEEEAFYVLDGEVSVLVDGQWSELSAGHYALVSRNTPTPTSCAPSARGCSSRS